MRFETEFANVLAHLIVRIHCMLVANLDAAVHGCVEQWVLLRLQHADSYSSFCDSLSRLQEAVHTVCSTMIASFILMLLCTNSIQNP